MLRVAVLSPSGETNLRFRAAFASEPDFDIFAVTTSSGELIQHALYADLVVIHDLSASIDLLTTLATIGRLDGGWRIVIADVPDDAQTIVRYFELGIRGYTILGEPSEQLVEVMRAVSIGGARVDGHIAPLLIQRFIELKELREGAAGDAPGSTGSESNPQNISDEQRDTN